MVLILGEVQTCALRHSGSASRAVAEAALALLPGARVRVSERPISYAVSPNTFAGVDCRVATRSGLPPRGVGTVTGRACLTGGRVLQGSVLARIDPVPAGPRRPWSHYLARPGVVETIGRTDLPGLAAAHLAAEREAPSTMGMGAFCARILAEVQGSSALDRRPPVRGSRTILRWAALITEDTDQVKIRFTVRDDGLRTVHLLLGPGAVADVAELCEDLAVHDWLLNTLVWIIEQSRIGTEQPAQSVLRLRPAVDHLLHLWMPAARLGDLAQSVWAALEAHPGLSRQWDAAVQRIRDQMAMAAALVSRPSP